MKQQRTQLSLLLVLIVLALVALSVIRFRGREAETEAGGAVVFQCDKERVTGLSIHTDRESVELVREEDAAVWRFSDTGEAANALRVEQMLSQIEEIRSDTVMEDVTDGAPYGLDAPGMVIALSYEGETHTLEIGDFSQGAKMFYARTDGETRVFLLSTLVQGSFDVTREELRGVEE